MKRLLLPLLAALALPTAVNAETVWLFWRGHMTTSFEKFPMKDMEQCIEEGEKIQERWKTNLKSRKAYTCVTGK